MMKSNQSGLASLEAAVQGTPLKDVSRHPSPEQVLDKRQRAIVYSAKGYRQHALK